MFVLMPHEQKLTSSEGVLCHPLHPLKHQNLPNSCYHHASQPRH
uniref:Uncharacterized protein n=1 Tax=Arundo donax TaxID=35708 RepID=A0A0A9FQH2_ARUDO